MKPVMNVLGAPLKEVVRNAKGEPILLNHREQVLANHLQEQAKAITNALGYEVNITTLTSIIKSVSEQKFFEIAPSDQLPVVVGEGTWGSNLLKYRDYLVADDFSTGLLNMGTNNARLAATDVGIDSVSIAIKNWAKEIGWTIMDLNQAAKSGNWDLVTSKERSRKKNWDLGIQKVAFLGLKGDSTCLGLYTQSGITTNTTRITQPISNMTADQLSAFIAAMLNDYRSNNNRTAFPTQFIVPESDYLGLAAPSSSTFPVVSKLQLMEDAFKLMTRNPGFKIQCNAYGDAQYNSAVLNKQAYVLLNYDQDSLRMTIPLDYTATLANSINNFAFQNVGYGQFTGVMAIRPLELYYYQY